MGISCVFITIFSNFYCVSAAQIVNGVVSALFAPAIAAITLGLVGRQTFALRIGRNEVFNHAGNVATALFAGIVGYLMGQVWIFYLVAIIGGASAVSVLFIRDNDIDYLRSRGGALKITPDGVVALSIRALFADRKILIFVVAATLFHGRTITYAGSRDLCFPQYVGMHCSRSTDYGSCGFLIRQMG